MEKKVKILLVDDEVSFAEIVGWDFQDAKFDVAIADGIDNAVEFLSHHEVDIILSDLMMPGGGAITLLEKLDQLSFAKSQRYIMTGHVGQIDEARLKDLGVKFIFKKPIKTEEVIHLMRENLDTL